MVSFSRNSTLVILQTMVNDNGVNVRVNILRAESAREYVFKLSTILSGGSYVYDFKIVLTSNLRTPTTLVYFFLIIELCPCVYEAKVTLHII